MDDRTAKTKADRPKSKGGRPRRLDPCSSVCTWLPADAHDRLIRRAMRADKSVSAYVREIIILTLR